MSTPDALTAVEYRADLDEHTITLHINGRPAPMFGQRADVRGVRTNALREAVLGALRDAVRDGARHGECDQMAEMAAFMSDRPTPGHVDYRSGRFGNGWQVTRADRADGEERILLTGGKPYYVGGDVANALERAFKVGGRYGHPDVDGLARPHPVPGGGIVTAVAIDRDTILTHDPARPSSVATDSYGDEIVARATAPDGRESFAVFRRYSGPVKATGHPDWTVYSPNPAATWQVVVADMDPATYPAWRGRRTSRNALDKERGTVPMLADWLNRTVHQEVNPEKVKLCDRCGRVLQDWPLERGDRCAPRDWVHCIRPA